MIFAAKEFDPGDDRDVKGFLENPGYTGGCRRVSIVGSKTS